MLATASKYYAEQQRLSALAVRQLSRGGDITKILRQLAIYQSTAALLALENGTNALSEQSISADGATVAPQAFTVSPAAPSVLSDAKSEMQFAQIVSTLVSDAGRSAMGVFTTSRIQEVGSIRVLTPPSCARCAVLAGRWYRWSDGFQRHPRCDCQMLPATRSESLYDPYAAYENGQIGSYRTMPDGSKRFEGGLTKAQREAIDAGADIGQVVNASRGLQTISFAGRRVQVTLEGTTARSLAYRSLSSRGTTTRNYLGPNGSVTRNVASAPRLSPEAIYRVADGDRDVAVRLLRINGYLL